MHLGQGDALWVLHAKGDVVQDGLCEQHRLLADNGYLHSSSNIVDVDVLATQSFNRFSGSIACFIMESSDRRELQGGHL